MKKNNSINREDFFKALSSHSNYIPEAAAREVYYGLVRLIIKQFKEGREINLPDLGKFRLIVMKGHKKHNIATGATDIIDLRKIAFSGSIPFKKYINQMVLREKD